MRQSISNLQLSQTLIDEAVAAALKEDLGLAGDVTTTATVDPDATVRAMIVARVDGVVSGLDVAEATFRALDPHLDFKPQVRDGTPVNRHDTIATVAGNAQAVLTAERVALNFVGHMSGIASLTACYVAAVQGTAAKIVDTRKTTPGLRAFEKYAVRCGGGSNHRSGLFDAVLIKDNHIVAAGGLAEAITRARTHAGHMVKIEVEVDTLDQLNEVLRHNVDAVLLDNMSVDTLKDAVRRAAGSVMTEASGGVTLDTVAAIAATGVDLISVGALTHSAPVLDVGLDFEAKLKTP